MLNQVDMPLCCMTNDSCVTPYIVESQKKTDCESSSFDEGKNLKYCRPGCDDVLLLNVEVSRSRPFSSCVECLQNDAL